MNIKRLINKTLGIKINNIYSVVKIPNINLIIHQSLSFNEKKDILEYKDCKEINSKYNINIDNIKLPESEKINSYLLKNNNSEIIKGLQFFSSEEKFLQIHGFVGTGKRQYINYISEFLSNDVIKLEYYCKESTVCDDILLAFSEIIEKSSFSN